MTYNALVLILSLYNDKKDHVPMTYFYGDKKFSGRQTNEAATKLTLSECDIKKLVCITSKETLTQIKNDLGDLTTYDYFKKEITDFCTEHNISMPEFVQIHDFCEVDNSPKVTSKLLDDVLKELKDYDVYIDTTGGGRDASLLIQLLVKYMENFGRKPQRAWYSSYKDKNIHDVTDSYRVMDLIDALGTFITTGISKGLAELVSVKNSALNDAINAIDKFSDEIHLNKIDHIEETLTEMNTCFNKVIGSDNSVELNNTEYMLKAIIPELQKGLFPNNKADIPDIIDWCIRNNMLQQALTIATERIPRYLFEDMGLVKCIGDKAALLKEKKTYEDEYYHLFYTKMLTATDIFRAEANNKKEKFIQQYLNGKLKNNKEFWNDFERLTEGITRGVNDTNIIFNHLCGKGRKAQGANAALIKYLIGRAPKTYADIAYAYADHKKKGLADLLGYPDLARKSENDSLNNKFLLVDSMDSCKQNDFEIAEGQLELFKKIAVGYLYIKAKRNQVNHSGDDTDMRDIQKILEKYGYSAQPDSITDNIQKFTSLLRAKP